MHSILHLITWFAGLGPAAFPIPQSGERTPAGARVEEARAEREEARTEVAGGDVEVVPLGERSDAVPLPRAARSRVGQDADEALEAAGGDPFFLSFAAGEQRPPPGERLDPRVAADAAPRGADARPREETYAFVMFGTRITEERVALLEAEGARVLAFHPHYAMKVAVDADGAARIAQLPFVRWVGRAREWQKVHPMLAERRLGSGPNDLLDVWVSTFEADSGGTPSATIFGSGSTLGPDGIRPLDPQSAELPVVWRSNGWQERRLAELGLDVQSYHESIAAFRGRLRAADLAQLLAQDFVQFVELDLPIVPLHDESIPMIQADRTRASWTGGTDGAVVAGIVDTGFDHQHFELNHTFAAGWDFTTEGSPWYDGFGHGSHVGGTLCGAGDVTEGYRGGAPGLGWGRTGRLFVLKIFDEDAVQAPGATTAAILSRTHSTFTDSGGDVTPRPHVINHSYGSGPGAFFGSEATARELDADIHQYDQLHVFSAGNYGPGETTLSVQASAKNTFTVGNVVDHRSDSVGYPGSLWSASSRGPTGDDRWKPNVVAPGRWVTSVDAETSDQYTSGSGTSMAAPHVTALAAQLCDRFPFLRYRPYTLGAVLMASALSKDGAVLGTPSTDPDHHLNTYGAGRVEAYRAMGSNGQQAFYFWAFSQGSSDYLQVEIDVEEGATRLTVAMYYHESAASAGAGSALVNDLDLWIDREPFSAGGASGEYFAHQSTRDNTELRMIVNPTAAAYRIKVVPDSATSTSRVGLCAIVTYGATRPEATIDVTASEPFVQPDEAVELTARVYNPSFVASGVHLTTSLAGPPFGDDPESAIVTLMDGVESDLTANPAGGTEVTLGNIGHGRSREVTWTRRWASEGVKSFSVTMRGDNLASDGDSDSVQVTVDGTPPEGPTDLVSTTHEVDVPSCSAEVLMSWTAATDALAGLAGYSYVWSGAPGTVPDETVDLGPGATARQVTLDDGTWYFHIRPIDGAGNWGTTQHFGPVVVQTPESYVFCTSTPTSTGVPAAIWFQGSLSVDANDLVLRASNLPAGQPCNFYYGTTEIQVPFGNGFRCVGGTIVRLPIVSTGSGELAYAVDNTDLPPGGDFVPGLALKFQCWFRDPLAGGAFHNLSNGLSLRFCP